MRKIALLLLLCTSTIYTSAQTLVKEVECNDCCPNPQLEVVNRDGYIWGSKQSNKTICIYDWNFDLIKTISIPAYSYIIFVFKSFFVDNGKFEILFGIDDENNNTSYKLYNEDGILLYDFEDYYPYLIGDANSSVKYRTIFTRNDRAMRAYRVQGGSSISQNASQSNAAYPSPANDIINISYRLSGSMLGDLVITDTAGKVVDNILVTPTANSVAVDVSAYPAGAYIYRVGDYFGKFIKK